MLKATAAAPPRLCVSSVGTLFTHNTADESAALGYDFYHCVVTARPHRMRVNQKRVPPPFSLSSSIVLRWGVAPLFAIKNTELSLPAYILAEI